MTYPPGNLYNEFTDKIIYRHTANILVYTGDQLAQRNVYKFATVVYKNFITISNYKELQHNISEITRLLTSRLATIYIVIIANKIIGYLIAEIVIHNNNKLMHIYYLYIQYIHRAKGTSTYLLNMIQRYAQSIGIKYLSLTVDTYDDHLVKYYIDQHFEYDSSLRSYTRYDMLVKYI